MKKRYVIILFWLYIALLFVATIIPLSVHTKVGIGIFRFRLDYWLHFAAYFGLAILYILRNYGEILNARFVKLMLHINCCVSIAFYAELIQWVHPTRSFNMKDFVASAFGALVAYLLFYITKNWVKSSKRPFVRLLFE